MKRPSNMVKGSKESKKFMAYVRSKKTRMSTPKRKMTKRSTSKTPKRACPPVRKTPKRGGYVSTYPVRSRRSRSPQTGRSRSPQTGRSRSPQTGRSRSPRPDGRKTPMRPSRNIKKRMSPLRTMTAREMAGIYGKPDKYDKTPKKMSDLSSTRRMTAREIAGEYGKPDKYDKKDLSKLSTVTAKKAKDAHQRMLDANMEMYAPEPKLPPDGLKPMPKTKRTTKTYSKINLMTRDKPLKDINATEEEEYFDAREPPVPVPRKLPQPKPRSKRSYEARDSEGNQYAYLNDAQTPKSPSRRRYFTDGIRTFFGYNN